MSGLNKTKKYSVSELYNALKESLSLQSHYATLLNEYDGGKRRGLYFLINGMNPKMAAKQKLYL